MLSVMWCEKLMCARAAISDPNDPNFDLEAYLTGVQARQ